MRFEINDQRYETEVALDIRILTLEQVFTVNFMNIRQSTCLEVIVGHLDREVAQQTNCLSS